MNIEKWLSNNTCSLSGKTVAVTGSTGGLGRELCSYLARLGASLVLLDRNAERSRAFADELVEKYPEARVRCIGVELESIESVRAACEQLLQTEIDIFIHNAGAYAIERRVCSTGYDNVFQINFVSPYYMIRTLLPTLRERGGRVVVVGSIAHRYSKTDESDVDFSTRKQASIAYGNAKRYLMFSTYALFEKERDATLAVTHPGIAFTNITAHYPKLVFALIKYPMKLIFMSPRRACLSILRGAFEPCGKGEWIGPRAFDIWGAPTKRALHSVSEQEYASISQTATRIYGELSEE